MLPVPGPSESVSDGSHGPLALVENVVERELDVTVTVLGTGNVVGAVPAASWIVSGPAAAPVVALIGGELNPATVGAQLANALHPVTAVAPSTVSLALGRGARSRAVG